MFSPLRLAAGLTVLAMGTLWQAQVSAAQLVRIGAAHFPPYTVRPEQGADTGLLPQLLEALNRAQTEYQFVLVPTSIPRRFRDFEQGRVDMAIFENPQWGWQDIPHTSVDMGLEDAEIFVAQRQSGRDQGYFAELKGKRLAVFSGYHYAFASFNPDPKAMAAQFNATLTYSHDSNLLMVTRGRADIALVTRSYLSDFMVRNADTAGQFLVSERIDQVYHHYALLRPKAAISGPAFAELLKGLRDSGELLKIFEPYRIDVLPVADAP
ncbi:MULTISPECIES: transporter substrate-binding domain-containing protein [Pseudomonas]|jgi:ABC-type amino acid transport substrate-binding protein|uniref:Transporter substrate-binding domain-containing protein n=2 Tax=Pseudomonas brenneri TaxID=129817 RepID=A0A5B2UWT4_9PSED|nr:MULTISPECIES: transporter substrate-binding domain-containing protein [Pseudomonas]KAA6176824.1 transporter substrate-binding domain-containing protein [Pseudomonas marginalis]KAA2230952.1 transporter substrate-binding domain-containing protein [Pseudomonas brenneri]MBF8004259.1 transporter substrate-binding domain-containing protein [Pseudomonas brenneri]TWR80457.1 transporter substrate-binding domain-containing protein [Pseudomonas brenneri]WJM89526.1 transporter substrate-binding domain-